MPVIGTQQSPIRIDTVSTLQAAFPANYFAIQYAAKALPGTFKGHDFEFSQFGKIIYHGKRFDLVKIHIHHPAEHRIDSTDSAMFECHLVHFAADDKERTGPKVVIGVFFHEVADAATPSSIKKLSEVLRLRGENQSQPLKWSKSDAGESLKIDPNHFLPSRTARDRWFHYQGSLTAGTFSEDVSWFVMESEIPVDPKHVECLQLHAQQKARETQCVNRRFVLRSFA